MSTEELINLVKTTLEPSEMKESGSDAEIESNNGSSGEDAITNDEVSSAGLAFDYI
jgi:hypothetical protein